MGPKHGMEADVVVGTTLVGAYDKAGELDGVNLLSDEDSISTVDDYSAHSLLPFPPLMSSSYSSLDCNQLDQLEQIMANDAIINGYRAVADSLSMMPPMTFDGGEQLPMSGLPNLQENSVMSTVPDYLGLDALLLPPGQGPSYFTQTGRNIPMGMVFPQSLVSMSNSGDEIYPENLLTRSDQLVRMDDISDYQQDVGRMGFYGLESSQQQMICGSTNLQIICEPNHHPAANVYSSRSSSSFTTLATEVSTLEESTFKPVKLSPEERKQKIQRYIQKRHERNFNKKIKYACRKTLADSRPRVRGRFAKNDELTDTTRDSDHHEDEDEDDEVIIIKEEETTIDTNILLAQLNSYKCNYSLGGWI